MTMACALRNEAFTGGVVVYSSMSDDTEAFAYRSTSPWCSLVRRRIQDLLLLQENWDSYGALPVDRRSVDHAVNLARDLATISGVDPPAIAATPNGDVGFCWDKGSWSLDLSVDPDGVISYVYLNELSGEETERRTRDVGELIPLMVQV